MPTPADALALLPVCTAALLAFALRPGVRETSSDVVAPLRLAVIRAALVVGAFAVASVELLSAVGGIRTLPFVALWVAGCSGALALALWRWRRDSAATGRAGRRNGLLVAVRAGWRAVTAGWRAASGPQRVLIAGLGGLVLCELVLALASAPNNADSNQYHLPKIEHWVAQSTVNLFPTPVVPQVILGPGAEYLLLHLRLLTGGDGLYNLLQWSAALGAALVASRIAAQLGAGRTGQLLAAFAVATAPAVVLESTSTQNDLVVGAWVVCTASLVLDQTGRRSTAAATLAIGAGAGLAIVTKATGWLALGPVLVLWGLAQLRLIWTGRRAVLAGTGRLMGSTLGIAAVVLALAGPHHTRLFLEYGNPIGPSTHTEMLSMQRHDPPAVFVNALRIGASTLVVPIPAVNRWLAGGVVAIAHAVGVDPQEPAITQYSSSYPNPGWRTDEDHSPYPVQAGLLLLSVAAVLAGRRRPGVVRGYALMLLGVLLVYAGFLKWQTWGNRLVLAALVLGAPLIGWWLEGALRAATGAWRRVLVPAVAVVVAVGLLHGYAAVVHGKPRRLLGQDSVFTLTEWEQRFQRFPWQEEEYRWAAEGVRSSGGRRVGLVMRVTEWEYPLWRLLPGVEFGWLDSSLPHHPPARPDTVDAIVCVAPEAECRPYLPAGWRYYAKDGYIGYALPPGAARTGGWAVGGRWTRQQSA